MESEIDEKTIQKEIIRLHKDKKRYYPHAKALGSWELYKIVGIKISYFRKQLIEILKNSPKNIYFPQSSTRLTSGSGLV